MMKKSNQEILLRTTLEVSYRADQTLITTFVLGEFENVRQAEKFRELLTRYNPDKLFLAKYEQTINPNYKLIANE